MPLTDIPWLLALFCGVTPQAGDPPASGYPERFTGAWSHVESGELTAAREAYLATSSGASALGAIVEPKPGETWGAVADCTDLQGWY